MMKNQPKPRPVMTVKKVTKKVNAPMPKTKVVSPTQKIQSDYLTGRMKKK